jgi:hypothetical protein
MASSSRVVRSLAVALVVAASAVAAGCSADGAAGLTTTAIVRLPTGFHTARPADDTVSIRGSVTAPRAATELEALRLEGAHRRAAAVLDADAVSSSAGGFVCQIDMGTVPLD